jgi:hypothetical protein
MTTVVWHERKQAPVPARAAPVLPAAEVSLAAAQKALAEALREMVDKPGGDPSLLQMGHALEACLHAGRLDLSSLSEDLQNLLPELTSNVWIALRNVASSPEGPGAIHQIVLPNAFERQEPDRRKPFLDRLALAVPGATIEWRGRDGRAYNPARAQARDDLFAGDAVSAATMLACLADDGHLDFSGIDDAERVAWKNPKTLAALQRFAAAEGSAGVVKFTLPPSSVLLSPNWIGADRIVGALHALTNLEELHIPNVRTGVLARREQAIGRLDLRGLRGLERLRSIELRGLRAPMLAVVPDKMRVSGHSDCVLPHPCMLAYVNDGNELVGDLCTMSGPLFYRQKPDYNPDLQLNGAGKLPVDAKGPKLIDDNVLCRHCVLLWHAVDDKRSPEADRDEPVLGHLNGAEKISAAVNPEIEQQFFRIRLSGPDAVFPDRDFGGFLDKECAHNLGPNDVHRFVVATSTHAMALKVERMEVRHGSQARQVCEMTFNDANDLTRDVVGRSSEARWSVRSLSELIAPGRLPGYFPLEPRFAMVYQTPPGAKREVLQCVSAQLRTSPGFMECALLAGTAQDVEKCAKAMTDSKAWGRVNALEGACAAAMILGRLGPLKSFVVGLMDAPVASRDKAKFLGNVLYVAILKGSAPAVHILLGELLKPACADELDIDHLPEALGMGPPPWVFDICAKVRIAGQREASMEIHRRNQAMQLHLKAILESSVVPMPDKLGHCASADPKDPANTAAREALKSGQPGAAAARICAVLESTGPHAPPKREALKALGVDLQQVFWAVATSPDPLDREWLPKLMALARTEPALKENMKLEKFEPIVAARDVARQLELAGGRITSIDPALREQCRKGDLRAAGLVVDGPDAGKMMCGSTARIDAFHERGYFQAPGPDAKQAQGQPRYSYWIPADLLLPRK